MINQLSLEQRPGDKGFAPIGLFLFFLLEIESVQYKNNKQAQTHNHTLFPFRKANKQRFIIHEDPKI